MAGLAERIAIYGGKIPETPSCISPKLCDRTDLIANRYSGGWHQFGIDQNG
ncbi:MAG: hypothetical protein ACI82Z_001955 [Cellvibrionaceae bacterium]|jgi:hypothetical protein